MILNNRFSVFRPVYRSFIVMWIIQMSRKNELKERAIESKGQCYTALPVTVLVHTIGTYIQ